MPGEIPQEHSIDPKAKYAPSWRNACMTCILQASGKRPPGTEITVDKQTRHL
ncbi:hypothetical protein J14TS2_45910 [Bacillus sp. J14TS2]|nr:hypothetical protein J14TS2_45910 [Bacillus sp. J14TS2]